MPSRNKLREQITARDHDTIAAFIVSEMQGRKGAPDRVMLEKQWKEVDRQIRMDPKAVVSESNDPGEAWLPQIEMPGQASALEINVKDAKRLLFPASTEWYSVMANVDDDFLTSDVGSVLSEQRFQNEFPLDPEPLLNLSIHSAMDYLHKVSRFRETWLAMLKEAYKYGPFVGRWVVVQPAVIGAGYRGFSGRKIPTLIAGSIKNHYPDNSQQAVMQEGVFMEPSMIRRWFQKTEDLRRVTGKGWVRKALNELDDDNGKDGKKNHTELVEYEGDLWIPRSQGGFYLRNHLVTVALGAGPKVVRIREKDIPFHSYIHSQYDRDDIDTAYGTSPLLKGRTLQEMASEAANAVAQAAALLARPPISYDADDEELAADGGPQIAPGKMWKSSNPEAIQSHAVGDPGVALALLQGVVSMFDDLTSTNEPRRGADPTSHTTAFAADVASSRSILRTEEFVNEVEEGPMSTALYQEYFLMRRMDPFNIPIDVRGTKGFVRINPKKLPEQAEFTVHGSRGVLNKREKRESLINLTSLLANLTPMLAQMEPEAIPQFTEMVRDLIMQHGVQDAARYQRRTETTPGSGAAGQPALPEDIGGVPGGPAVAA